MAQPKGFVLACVNDGAGRGHQFPDLLEQVVFFLLFQGDLDFKRAVKMILKGFFPTARYKDNLFNACLEGFFHSILDQGFVHHRKHLLGHGFGSRYETGAQSRDRKNRFFYFHGDSFACLHVVTVVCGCVCFVIIGI